MSTCTWWGGQQAARGRALYAPGARYSFTYPPFAALLFSIGADAREGYLAIAITSGSICALEVLCWQALGAAGARPRPETVFATSALALLTWPVAYTLHLGEVNLILAALAGTALALTRERAAAARAGTDRNPGPSPRMRWLVT